LIAAKLKLAPERVTDNARLVKDLHADEIDMVELVGSLEDSFEIGHISDLDSVDLVTVKDVVRYVDSHVPKRAAKPAAAKPAATKRSLIERVDCHDKQNWRRFLHTGMTQSEVRQLFGEPEHISVAGSAQIWEYGGGRIDFAHESLFSWDEP
jgi:acyl carrier protein